MSVLLVFVREKGGKSELRNKREKAPKVRWGSTPLSTTKKRIQSFAHMGPGPSARQELKVK